MIRAGTDAAPGRRRDRGGMSKIVVGIDGSPASTEALKWAVGEARLRDAELHAVHTWQFPTMAETYPGIGSISSEVFDGMRSAAEAALETALDAADTSGIKVTTEVAEGSAAQTLLEAAASADLLVVGSRGRGGFSGLLLGSVSQQCAQHAPCPIVIVRARADKPSS